MTLRTGVLAIAAIAALSAGAAAHHNMTAVYDLNDRVALAGTLTKVDWRNPHIYIDVDATREGGKVETWKAEGPAPFFFRSRDTSKADFEQAIGKPVKLEVSRARDRSTNGLLRVITLPGGKVVSLCPENC